MTDEPRTFEIDDTDAKIAFCRHSGLPPAQIAKTVNITSAALRQRLRVKKAFFTEFARFSLTVEARFHTVGGDAGDDPDLWQDGRFLAQQAAEQAESEAMLPNGRA